ncbi:hypothetical protein ERO13_D10G225733v2 [Gossypium hirsutum]|nr:hypothetical protein ERO13_D10G225733v2 [Gossypium hirsutum]
MSFKLAGYKREMEKPFILHFVFGVLSILGISLMNVEYPYLYFAWTLTYGTRSILGVPRK